MTLPPLLLGIFKFHDTLHSYTSRNAPLNLKQAPNHQFQYHISIFDRISNSAFFFSTSCSNCVPRLNESRHRLQHQHDSLAREADSASIGFPEPQHAQQIWARGRPYAFSVVSQSHFHRAPKACRWLQALINHWPATLTPAVGFHVRGHPESVERPAMTAFKRSPGPASPFSSQVF